MVVTRLYEVTAKGTEWAYGSGYETPQKSSDSISPLQPATPGASSETSSNSYWNYASNSLQYATDSAYSRLANLVSSLYSDAPHTPAGPELSLNESPDDLGSSHRSLRTSRRRSSLLNATDLAMMLRNPYNSVRGRYENGQTHRSSSVSAVRSLLTLVPETSAQDDENDTIKDREGILSPEGTDDPSINTTTFWTDNERRPLGKSLSPSETASQIAEGTIRAMRDLELDEAVELQAALRFWTERWERPLLSWLEAGPLVWTSPGGYNHKLVGQKVAQIQAVLARRCAAIGELQQHLLRAGWQRGVEGWSVLGQGGQWAAVAGFDGTMSDDAKFLPTNRRMSSDIPEAQHQSRPCDTSEKIYNKPPLDPQQANTDTGQFAANVFVWRKDGGGIFVDDPAFLAEWSIEALALVRRQLKRAANRQLSLPYEDNWKQEISTDEAKGEVIVEADEKMPLPLWASESGAPKTDTTASEHSMPSSEPRSSIVITDLPLMAEEVSELLNVMEDIMAVQRERRLEKLRPPSWLRRNWYIAATTVPSVSYVLYRMLHKGYARDMIKLAIHKISSFFRERVIEPIVAIVNEIWGGRESFSDKEARMEAIESLKKMIRSWLDDTFPDMPEAKRIELSEAMDVTLLEQQKEESMKTFFEINNVIRMSFIEMQYMKKELLNALSAIDAMMSANDINMNIAAITPVVLLSYFGIEFFRFVYYFLLKLGKSREETYASFRSILTDIDRLLVMRDNPPIAPLPPSYLQRSRGKQESQMEMITQQASTKPSILDADDLGMLMLLIHECRSILWHDRRRFASGMIRSVAEDLAELAGERGAVSVQQQLQIVARMSRTYPFLKVISTGHTFNYTRLRTVD